MSTSASATRVTDAAPPRRVSHRHDVTERQADRAADIVSRGGSVTGWSFANVPAEASVHRDEDESKKKLEEKPRTQDEAYKEAAGKAVEAGVETELPSGKKVREVIEETPPLAGAAVGALALAGKDVPVSGFPGVKDVVPPGVSIGLRAEGLPGLLSGEPRPGGGPTRFTDIGLGLTFGYTEQLPKGGKKRQSAAEKQTAAIAADTARLKNDPVMRSIEAARLRQQGLGPGPAPFTPPVEMSQLPAYLRNPGAGAKPGGHTPSGVQFTESALPPPFSQESVRRALQEHHRKEDEERKRKAEEEKKREDPVQREPATTSEAPPANDYDTSGVDAATRGGGRTLDPSLRHSMEARFGYDFSSVRLHDDPQAASAAAGVDAAAFTVGEHIVFGSGRFDPSSLEGRHLLAHELAHVVQERGSGAPRTTSAPTRIHRLDVGNWFALLFGGEGTWTDQELRDYLLKITAAGAHEGWWESDNKARAIVRKFMAGAPGWDLLPSQKVLLIDEMLDGSVLDEDEDGILNLVETASATDLGAIFADPKARYAALDSAIDGAEHKRLLAFAALRFAKGVAGLKAGDAEVVGDPVPKGAPSFPFDARMLDARLDGAHTSAEITAIVDRLSPADRARARDHLLQKSWPANADELGSVVRTFAGLTKNDPRKPELLARMQYLQNRRRKIKEVLSKLLLELVPRDEESLRTGTAAVPTRDPAAVRELLSPNDYPEITDEIELDDPAPAKQPAAPPAPATPETPVEADPPPKTAAEKKADEARRREEDRKRAADEEKRFGPKSDFRKELQELTATTLDAYYQARHVNVGKRGTKEDLEPMVPHAVDATDTVFGGILPSDRKRKPGDPSPVSFGEGEKEGNLHLLYDFAHDKWKRMDAVHRRKEAMWWIRYHHRADPAILAFHASKQSRAEWGPKDVPKNAVARTISAIATDLTQDGASDKGWQNPTTTADKVLATWRGWPGLVIGNQVYLALYEGSTVEETRRLRWRMFKTVIHEYLHTLAHKKYDKYAETFGNSSAEYTTLIEGVDDVFAGMVWQHVRPRMTTDAALREDVEGEPYWRLPPLTPMDPGNYPAHTEAMRLTAEVGLQNVMAAYFLGLLDRLPLAKDGKGAKK